MEQTILARLIPLIWKNSQLVARCTPEEATQKLRDLGYPLSYAFEEFFISFPDPKNARRNPHHLLWQWVGQSPFYSSPDEKWGAFIDPNGKVRFFAATPNVRECLEFSNCDNLQSLIPVLVEDAETWAAREGQGAVSRLCRSLLGW